MLEDVDESYDELCSGDREDRKALRVEREKVKKLPRPCPAKECDAVIPAGVHACPECGFEARAQRDIETKDDEELHEVKGKKKTFTKEEKQQFYSELLGWRDAKKAKNDIDGKTKVPSSGRIAHMYREKFDVWPRQLSETPKPPTMTTLNYIKSRNIAYAKAMQKKNK
jgi:hypothetical protein